MKMDKKYKVCCECGCGNSFYISKFDDEPNYWLWFQAERYGFIQRLRYAWKIIRTGRVETGDTLAITPEDLRNMLLVVVGENEVAA